jgi:glycosyltransferase involved in cell wall biosynthesis
MVAATGKVSLCLAAFDEERHIGEMLESIRCQTHRDIEVHVFDNASTDRTPAICRDYLADGRFRYHRNAVNIGPVRNYNRVHAVAEGEYVVPLSANDVLEPTFVERLLEVMQADPAVGLAAARIRVIDENSRLLPQDQWQPQRIYETSSADPVAAGVTVMRNWHYANYFFGMYRRTVMERLQPQRYLYGGDVAFVCELALYADIRFVDEPLFRLRRHEREQVQHLARVFSEETLLGLDERSLFRRFDCLTPYVDFTWAYLEMISLARIAEAERQSLARQAVVTQRQLYGPQMRREAAALVDAAAANEPLWGQPGMRVPRMMLGHRLLERATRARIVLPEEAALADLCTRLTAALGAAALPVAAAS